MNRVSPRPVCQNLQSTSPRPTMMSPGSPMQTFLLVSSPHRSGNNIRPVNQMHNLQRVNGPMTNYSAQYNPNCRTPQNQQQVMDCKMNPNPSVQNRLGMQQNQCTQRMIAQTPRVPSMHSPQMSIHSNVTVNHNMNQMNSHHHHPSVPQSPMNPPNTMGDCMNQNQRFGHIVSPTSCCQGYNQTMNQQQPLTSPAAATTAPMQPQMIQPHQARHCNCNSQHCNAHQHCQTMSAFCSSASVLNGSHVFYFFYSHHILEFILTNNISYCARIFTLLRVVILHRQVETLIL